MNTNQMISCFGLENGGFKAGQISERERIQELIRFRQDELRALLTTSTSPAVQRTARAAIGELRNLLNQLIEAG